MSMILEKLILNNFGNHSNTEIDLEAVTTVIGKSDSGKTHLFRALSVLFNEDTYSEQYIKTLTTSSSIKCIFNDKSSFQKTRSKKEQEFIITKKDGTEERYKGTAKSLKNFTVQNCKSNFVSVYDTADKVLEGSPEVYQRNISGILGTLSLENLKKQETSDLFQINKELVNRKNSVKGIIRQLRRLYSQLRLQHKLEKLSVKKSVFDKILSFKRSKLTERCETLKLLSQKTILYEQYKKVSTFRTTGRLLDCLYKLKNLVYTEELLKIRKSLTDLYKLKAEKKICETCGKEID